MKAFKPIMMSDKNTPIGVKQKKMSNAVYLSSCLFLLLLQRKETNGSQWVGIVSARFVTYKPTNFHNSNLMT